MLITGATSRLGLEATIHYVNLGNDSVIVTARTALRSVEAKKPKVWNLGVLSFPLTW